MVAIIKRGTHVSFCVVVAECGFIGSLSWPLVAIADTVLLKWQTVIRCAKGRSRKGLLVFVEPISP